MDLEEVISRLKAEGFVIKRGSSRVEASGPDARVLLFPDGGWAIIRSKGRVVSLEGSLGKGFSELLRRMTEEGLLASPP